MKKPKLIINSSLHIVESTSLAREREEIRSDSECSPNKVTWLFFESPFFFSWRAKTFLKSFRACSNVCDVLSILTWWFVFPGPIAASVGRLDRKEACTRSRFPSNDRRVIIRNYLANFQGATLVKIEDVAALWVCVFRWNSQCEFHTMPSA